MCFLRLRSRLREGHKNCRCLVSIMFPRSSMFFHLFLFFHRCPWFLHGCSMVSSNCFPRNTLSAPWSERLSRSARAESGDRSVTRRYLPHHLQSLGQVWGNLQNSGSMGWLKGKSTGNIRKPEIFPWHMGFSCNFSLKPIKNHRRHVFFFRGYEHSKLTLETIFIALEFEDWDRLRLRIMGHIGDITGIWWGYRW